MPDFRTTREQALEMLEASKEIAAVEALHGYPSQTRVTTLCAHLQCLAEDYIAKCDAESAAEARGAAREREEIARLVSPKMRSIPHREIYENLVANIRARGAKT